MVELSHHLGVNGAALTKRVVDPANPTERAPLLVLLHGLGSDEVDLLGLASAFPATLRTVTLRAPNRYGMGGYSWFSIEWTPQGIRMDEVEAHRSLQLLAESLESLTAEYQPSCLILGGFSQGAIMTTALILRRPELVAGAVLLSGADRAELFEGTEGEVRGLPVFVQHGFHDPVLPVEGGRALRDRLIVLGADVEYHEYLMAHEVTGQSMLDMRTWLTAQLA